MDTSGFSFKKVLSTVDKTFPLPVISPAICLISLAFALEGDWLSGGACEGGVLVGWGGSFIPFEAGLRDIKHVLLKV